MKLFFENSAKHLRDFYNSNPLTKRYFSGDPNLNIIGLVITLVVRTYETYEGKKLNTEEKLYKIASEIIVPRMMNIGGGIADFVLLRSDEDVRKMSKLITDKNQP
jgi:hypothetical protein